MGIVEEFARIHGSLTGIQKAAIPIIQQGNNCLIIAPTGSGKTEAAMLPLIERIDKNAEGIQLLYITPLRALNRNLLARLADMFFTAGISMAVRHGDTTPSERARQARKKPQVLILTPETFQNILPSGTFSNALKNVKAVVVDELHELAGSKRGTQLSLALERLAWLSGRDFQRIGISATISDEEGIARFLFGRRPYKLASSNYEKEISFNVELPSFSPIDIGDAAKAFELDEASSARLGRIIELIKKSQSVLIFANTRQIVEALGSRLVYIDKELHFGGIGIHHSSLNAAERIEIEEGFRNGAIKSVIATSSLELGIDIGSIDLVIQYGSPRQASRLVQRVGRSGHSAGRVSKGIIIANSPLDEIEANAICMNALEGKLEKVKMHENALDVLMHQLCGMLIERGKSPIEELYNEVIQSGAYASMAMQPFKEVLAFMSERKLAIVGDYAEPTSKTRFFYYEHVSFIEDTKKFAVKDMYTGKRVSTLDERFVEASIEEGVTFITKGVPWKVVSIDEDCITVEPSEDFAAAIPEWEGEDMPVSYETASKVFDIFNAGHGMSKQAQELIKAQNAHFPLGKLSIAIGKGYQAIYAPFGTLASDALGRIISSKLVGMLGKSIAMRISPYMVFLEFDDDIDIKKMLLSIDWGKIEDELENAISKSDLFIYKFISIAKFFGIIDKSATISKALARKIAKSMESTIVYKETMRELMHNYFDIESLKAYMQALPANEIKEIYEKDMCPLGKAVLNSLYYTRELLAPALPSSLVIESFMKFTLAKRAELLCTYCGFTFSRKLEEIAEKDKITCPVCGSTMIAMRREGYEKIAKKIKKGKLSRPERALANSMIHEASLINSYGGKAIVALSVYGIGDSTAARILKMFRHTSREFFMDLIDAQKQFIRTKKYWAA
ncbi:MAG: DEAD/DEAH box helicase [Candidatus Micrarchaeaceae archaeon]